MKLTLYGLMQGVIPSSILHPSPKIGQVAYIIQATWQMFQAYCLSYTQFMWTGHSCSSTNTTVIHVIFSLVGWSSIDTHVAGDLQFRS